MYDSPLTGKKRAPQLLYVGGFSRSGSTLLGRMLSGAEGSICVGELRYIWSRGVQDNVQCGCGEPFLYCPFWAEVGKEAFGGWRQLDMERVLLLDRQANRFRVLPFHWKPHLKPGFTQIMNEYVGILTTLYRAIASVAGVDLVVDISKDPNFGSLLSRMPHYDVRIVHLVRDPRAVSYSWLRTKQMPSPIGELTVMPNFRPTEVAAKWMAWNIAFQALSRNGVPYRRVSYEDLVTRPADTMLDVAQFSDRPRLVPPGAFQDGKVRLGTHHIFSGNPMRASSGWLTLDLDDEWRTELADLPMFEVNAITFPLLQAYGYELGRKPRGTRA